MKKLITAAVLSTVLLVNAAFANKNENGTNYKVETAFNQEFSQAKEVNWQKSDNFYKVGFKLNNEVMTAYFTTDGELMGVIHNMLSSQLPINLLSSLKKDYDGFWITELFECAKSNSNSYFITLHNADQVVILQSTDGASWSTYSKSKK